MLSESNSELTQRFLLANCRFGTKALEIMKNECRNLCTDKKKTNAYIKYLNWRGSEREVALLTNYAYADLTLPKVYNCIFDYNKPQVSIQTEMKITHSIWEYWFPIDTIEHGHKHLIIAKFEKAIPNLIYKLFKQEGQLQKVPNDALTLGICQIENYTKIKEDLRINAAKVI